MAARRIGVADDRTEIRAKNNSFITRPDNPDGHNEIKGLTSAIANLSKIRDID
jgi:hypothetical protein